MPKEFKHEIPEEPVDVVELPEEEEANVATLEIENEEEETQKKVRGALPEESETDEE